MLVGPRNFRGQFQGYDVVLRLRLELGLGKSQGPKDGRTRMLMCTRTRMVLQNENTELTSSDLISSQSLYSY